MKLGQLIKTITLTRNKAGGSALENIDIQNPPEARTLMYANVIEGAGNVLSNQLLCRLVLRDGVVDVAQANNTSVFTNLTTNQGRTSLATSQFGGNYSRWAVQANAVTSNEFALVITFYAL